MPKVVDAARATTRSGAVWRHCARCAVLAPLAPDDRYCPACQPEPVDESHVAVLLRIATLNARGPAGAAEDFDRLADQYSRPSADAAPSVGAGELHGLVADLREAAARLRGRWSR